ncbi:hypothetical protein A9Q87_05485 [Flavobacteriales bacterium 34_180_T64]|nr:hypothetical protein A9Q87_05485 [Flavobacteriales bacterium 34_180_T64]
MKRFLTHIVLFLILFGISSYLILSQADGHTDAFYTKFTTKKQNALIIGSSRAAQGIQPKVINNLISNLSIYNYAFSRVHTPYGKPYLSSIQKKLDSNTSNGIFLVEVNPWSICKQKGEVLDLTYFKEQDSFLGEVENPNSNPNLTYLLNYYNGRYVEILTKKGKNHHGETLFVHNDGWFEVKLEDSPERTISRIKSTVKSYKNIRNEYEGKSNIRMDFLMKTIQFLQEHGSVYLVRLPINEEMLTIENGLLPRFDSEIMDISRMLNAPYINLMPSRNNYKYTDGHHLNYESGQEVSKIIAELIKKEKL